MTRYMDEYFKAAQDQLAAITHTQRATLDQAAGWVAETLLHDRFIYAFGSGHRTRFPKKSLPRRRSSSRDSDPRRKSHGPH